MKNLFLVSVLALGALGGCCSEPKVGKPSTPVFQAVAKAPEPDYSSQIDKDLDSIRRRIQFNNRFAQAQDEAIHFVIDCKGVTAEEWDAKNCDARKASSLKRMRRLNLEAAALSGPQ